MVSDQTLEERIVFLTRLWRNFANFEYPFLLDQYDCMDKAGNLLARMLPHACEFADRLARMDHFKSAAERQATDDGSLHFVLAEMMIVNAD
ncbi:MAG: hypothetical protein ACU0GE_15035 [Pseudooceanicola nanhaiensis]|uniref:hypothetical protein n=1 Tax=Rhodobacterales TaxID=204455 RepID=UPI00405916CF